MLSLIKILPIFLAIILAGIFYHNWSIRGFENRQVQLQMQIDSLQQNNVALQAAADININTINQMQSTAQRQNQQIMQLNQQIISVQRERDDYLSVFRRHDLTNLARARPGLIEPRINNGTREVFAQLEQDTMP